MGIRKPRFAILTNMSVENDEKEKVKRQDMQQVQLFYVTR